MGIGIVVALVGCITFLFRMLIGNLEKQLKSACDREAQERAEKEKYRDAIFDRLLPATHQAVMLAERSTTAAQEVR